MHNSYQSSPIAFVQVSGHNVAFRRIGVQHKGTPILFLNHLAANLDGYDPLIMNELAQHFTVIAVDYVGMGLSGGKVATSVEQMAQEIAQFVQALGYAKVHLLGLSLGGFVAQALLQHAPQLVNSVILAGTGPSGDRGIRRVRRITFYDMLRGAILGRDPRFFLFFPPTNEARREAKAFLQRVGSNGQVDKRTTLSMVLRQLRAVQRWASAVEQDFSQVHHRVWVVNGDIDRMVPTSGSYALAERLPNATLSIYESAGHGAIFQEAEWFVQQAVAFFHANERKTHNTNT